MPLTVERGFSSPVANGYISSGFLTAYLEERNRSTENGYDTASSVARDAAIIAATSYIDTRWGARLRGIRKKSMPATAAVGIVEFMAATNVVENDTITIEDTTYTFKSSPATVNEVELGNSVLLSLENFVNIVNEQNLLLSATKVKNQTVVRLTTLQTGAHGNYFSLASNSNGLTTTPFSGGADGGSQPLEFPRFGLYDSSGRTVEGIPTKLCQATAEYAIRALNGQLYTDPTVSVSGRSVRESYAKIGPIEERTVYEAGGAVSSPIKPYPAADRLLAEYLTPGGRAIRG